MFQCFVTNEEIQVFNPLAEPSASLVRIIDTIPLHQLALISSLILALGPLTNLAEALEGAKSATKVIQNLVIMGGAVRVQGNLPDGEFFKTDNITAEWNFFIDPQAADRVFNAGLPIRLVPLDATSRVPIGPEFLKELEQMKRNKLGDTVLAILRTEKDLVDKGIYQAWDPLAAVALVDPRVVVWENLTIRIKQEKPEEGRSQLSPGLYHLYTYSLSTS